MLRYVLFLSILCPMHQMVWVKTIGMINIKTYTILVDVDECSPSNPRHKCHGLASCVNIAGDYECECNSGYDGKGFNTVDGCKGKHTMIMCAIFNVLQYSCCIS